MLLDISFYQLFLFLQNKLPDFERRVFFLECWQNSKNIKILLNHSFGHGGGGDILKAKQNFMLDLFPRFYRCATFLCYATFCLFVMLMKKGWWNLINTTQQRGKFTVFQKDTIFQQNVLCLIRQFWSRFRLAESSNVVSNSIEFSSFGSAKTRQRILQHQKQACNIHELYTNSC